MKATSTDLVSLFAKAIRDNWDYASLSDYGGSSFTFADVGEKVLTIHALLKNSGIGKGDKVALFGKNSANWGIIYISVVTYGAVIVPILPDFKAADVHHIVTHSDSLILFAEDSLFGGLDPQAMPLLKRIFKIQDLSVIFEQEEFPILNVPSDHTDKITPEDIRFEPSNADDIAVISYTSGTTGFSKGVVIQHKSLLGNILYAHKNMPLNPKDKILSFLPLAHTYG
jgi:long-chain acyl-CoA synthetase